MAAGKATPREARHPSPAERLGEDRFVRACLIAAVALVPASISNLTWTRLYAAPLTFDQFQLPKVLLLYAAAAAGLAAVAAAVSRRKDALRVDRSLWLAVAFLVWASVATFTSVAPAVSVFGTYHRFSGLLTYLAYVVVFFLALQFVDRPSAARRVLAAVCAGGFVVAAYGLLQRLGLDPVHWPKLPFEQGRAFSAIGNPITLGGYLLFPLCLAPALALSEERRWARVFYWVIALISGACLIVTFTRGAWLAAVVGAVVLAVAIRRSRTTFSRLDLGMLVVSALLLLVALGTLAPQIAARASSLFGADSRTPRVEIWRSAAAATAARPLTGWGPDTFGIAFPRYETAAYVAATRGTETVDNAHSDALETAATTGIPGVLLLYAAFAFVLARSASGSFGGENRLLFGATWAAVAAYLAYLLTGISVPATGPVLWTCLGVLAATRARSIEVPAAVGRVSLALTAGLAAITLVFIVAAFYADMSYLRSAIAADPGEAVSRAEAAAASHPFEVTYREAVAEAQSRLAMQSLRETPPSDRPFYAAEKTFREILATSPWHYPARVRLARLYDLGADMIDGHLRERAISVASEGLATQPYGVDLLFELGIAYSAEGRNAEAEAALRRALRIQPANRGACLLLGRILDSEGKRSDAAAVYREFLRTVPGDSVVSAALSSATEAVTK